MEENKQESLCDKVTGQLGKEAYQSPIHPPTQSVCPNCGYCPCCGRPRGDWNYPISPYPHWPITPMYQGPTC